MNAWGGQFMFPLPLIISPPIIPFEVNSGPDHTHGDPLWAKTYHYFSLYREEFMDHYRKRSNVETAFAMTKAKFGGTVRFKNPAAQVNEVLVKIRCHYICVLVQAMYALCGEPTFASKPVRPFLGSRFPFRLPPSPVDPVSFGTGFTAGPGRYGRCSARYTEALFDGFPPFLSGMEAAIFPALRGRGPLPLGLHLLTAFGFKGCRSRRGAGLRLLGLRRGPS